MDSFELEYALIRYNKLIIFRRPLNAIPGIILSTNLTLHSFPTCVIDQPRLINTPDISALLYLTCFPFPLSTS